MRKTLFVLSGKGGVGKTTIAVNLSYFLSDKGNSVGILDADIHGPNVLKLVKSDKQNMEVINEKIEPIEITPKLKVVSMAGLVDDDSAVIWRGPMKHNALKQLTQDVNWGDLDYFIVDFPPGTGDEHISASQLLNDISGAVIVTSPQKVSLLDMMRTVDFCKKMKINIIGLIENMSGGIFGGGTVKELCKKNSLNFLGSLSLDKEIVDSGENSKSFLHCDNKKLNNEFNLIVKNILGGIKNENSNKCGK